MFSKAASLVKSLSVFRKILGVQTFSKFSVFKWALKKSQAGVLRYYNICYRKCTGQQKGRRKFLTLVYASGSALIN